MADKDGHESWWKALLQASPPTVRLVVIDERAKEGDYAGVKEVRVLQGGNVREFLNAVPEDPAAQEDPRCVVVLAYHTGETSKEVDEAVREKTENLLRRRWSEGHERSALELLKKLWGQDEASFSLECRARRGAALATALQLHTGIVHVFVGISGEPLRVQVDVVENALDASWQWPKDLKQFEECVEKRRSLIVGRGAFRHNVSRVWGRLEGLRSDDKHELWRRLRPLFEGGDPPRTVLGVLREMWARPVPLPRQNEGEGGYKLWGGWDHVLRSMQGYARALCALWEGDVDALTQEVAPRLGEVKRASPDAIARSAVATYLRVSACPSLRDALRFRGRNVRWYEHLYPDNLLPDLCPSAYVRTLGAFLLFPWSVRQTLAFLRPLLSKGAGGGNDASNVRDVLKAVQQAYELGYAPLARALTPHMVAALEGRTSPNGALRDDLRRLCKEVKKSSESVDKAAENAKLAVESLKSPRELTRVIRERLVWNLLP